MPNAEDKVAPFLGRELEGRWRRNSRAVRDQLWRQLPVANAPHLVAVPAIIPDHLGAFIRDLPAGRQVCWVIAAKKSVAVKTSKLRLILALSRER
jgi:hypothetical protein